MRCRVIYRGRVQGVGFRATVRSIAAGYAVTGWVRNEPDGAVHLEAQGDPDEVNRFLDRVRASVGSRIVSADATQVQECARETGFLIAR